MGRRTMGRGSARLSSRWRAGVAALLVLVVLTLGSHVSTADTTTPPTEAPPSGEDADRVQSIATADGEVSVQEVAGGTRFYVDQTQSGVYRVDSGFDLDRYLYRSSGPLDFSLQLDRSFGPVEDDGRPSLSNSLYGKVARLTMRVFDVDDDYQGTFAAERDAIVVNGHRLEPYASGADSQWSINTFLVPTDY